MNSVHRRLCCAYDRVLHPVWVGPPCPHATETNGGQERRDFDLS